MKVGAIVRLGPLVDGGSPPRFDAVRDIAQHIESVGLDSVWVYDHLLYRWPGKPSDGIWECWTVLSALATLTTRVGLGTIVMCTQFRNPALLAKMAITLDEVSGGRLTLGIGAGWHQPEFDAFGIPFDHRAGRFDEAIQIIAPLLREGRVDFRGQYYAAPDCEIIPSGPRPSGPPLLVAGKGPRMLRLTAQYADAWNTAWHTSPDTAVGSLEDIRSACHDVAREPGTLGLTANVMVAYADLVDRTPPNTLRGTTDEIAEALGGYARLGVSELIVDVIPHTPEAITRFAEAVTAYRHAQSAL